MNIFGFLRNRKSNSASESAAQAVMVESLEHRMLLSAVSPLSSAQQSAILSAPLNGDLVRQTSDAEAGTSASSKESHKLEKVTETHTGSWEFNLGPFKFGGETTVTNEYGPEAPAGEPTETISDGDDDSDTCPTDGGDGDDSGGDDGGDDGGGDGGGDGEDGGGDTGESEE